MHTSPPPPAPPVLPPAGSTLPPVPEGERIAPDEAHTGEGMRQSDDRARIAPDVPGGSSRGPDLVAQPYAQDPYEERDELIPAESPGLPQEISAESDRVPPARVPVIRVPGSRVYMKRPPHFTDADWIGFTPAERNLLAQQYDRGRERAIRDILCVIARKGSRWQCPSIAPDMSASSFGAS